MKKNKFTLLSLMLLLCISFLFAVFLLPRIAKAQPYFTNTGTIYGAQTYNQAYPTPLQPSKTLAAQYAAGILAGTGQTSNDGTCTNSFGTNIFSVAPIVVLTQTTNGTPSSFVSGTNIVTAVTTSNFVANVYNGKTNVWFNWIAIGH